MEEGRVNKRIKPAIGERFQGDNLTTNHTKHTQEFTDSGDSFRAERAGVCSTSRSQVGWAGGWKKFRGSKEAGGCARGRAHSDRASSVPPPPATSEFGYKTKNGGGEISPPPDALVKPYFTPTR
jgi:hypothetical protein